MGRHGDPLGPRMKLTDDGLRVSEPTAEYGASALGRAPLPGNAASLAGSGVVAGAGSPLVCTHRFCRRLAGSVVSIA